MMRMTRRQHGDAAMKTIVESRSIQHTNPVDSISSHDAPGHRQNNWEPVWLSKPFLFTLAALFTAFSVTLIIIWRTDQAQLGFAASFSNTRYYAWTYGPTAVVVLLGSLWRQLDFYCKVVQPWTELSCGPADASRTVLLDYVTPLSIVSLVRASQYRHLPVVLSIAGYAVLKLILLFSTGLLVLSPTTLTKTANVTLVNDFAYTDALKTAVENNTYGNFYTEFQDNQYFLDFNATPAYQYNSLLQGATDQSMGQAGSDVYQTIARFTDTVAGSISTRVRVLRPNTTCEVAHIGSEPSFLQLQSATCTSQNKTFEENWFSCQHNMCPPEAINWYLGRVNCSNEPTPASLTTPYDLRYGFMVARYTYDWAPYQLRPSLLQVGQRQEFSAVICTVDYSIGMGTLEFDEASNATRISDFEPGQSLEDFPGFMLGEATWESIMSAAGFVWTDPDNLRNSSKIFDPAQNFYYLILNTLPSPQNLSHLLHSDLLGPTVTQVFNGVAAHFVRTYAMSPVSTQNQSTIRYTEDRLRVSSTSFWTITTSLLVLTLVVIGLLLTLRHPSTQTDPSLIVTAASVLARSDELQNILRQAGALSTSDLAALTSRYEFCFISHSNTISLSPTRLHVEDVMRATHDKDEIWVPIAARWFVLIPMLISPLLLIIVLEILSQISQAKNGIADVTAIESSASVAARYLTALVVLLIATMYNGFDFTIALFAPFEMLRKGAMPAQSSIAFQIIGKLPLIALTKSLQRRHYSSFMSNLAAFLAGLLAIAASGLWLVQYSMSASMSVQASLIDDWNTSWPKTSGDGGAANYLEKLHSREEIMPPEIWDDWVLPGITDVDILAKTYNMQSPALRPSLDCQIVADKDIELSWDDLVGQIVTARPTLEGGCRQVDSHGTQSNYTYRVSLQEVKESASGVGIENEFMLKWLGSFDNLKLQDERYTDQPGDCPTIGALIAHWITPLGNLYDNLTVVLCSQKLERRMLNVTYDGGVSAPKISVSTRPSLLNSSTAFQQDPAAADKIVTTSYQVADRFAAPHTALTEHIFQNFSENVFVNYLVSGADGVAADQLVGRENRQAFMEAVQRQYARYMSLVVHLQFRQAYQSESSLQDRLVYGSATVLSSRLQLNVMSKIILQVLLASMSVLGTLSFALSSIRTTLPRQPSSIASVMALLAGSDLCNQDIALLDGPTAGGMARRPEVVMKSCRFSLGWWSIPAKNQGSRNSIPADSMMTRFGIDAGLADQLGYQTNAWHLRQRRRPGDMSSVP